MRIAITLFIVLLLNIGLIGQTVITSASFPAPGDVLKTLTAARPAGDFIGGSGAAQTWNFSNLTAQSSSEEEFLDLAGAEFDSLFVNATTYLSLGLGEGESFYQSSATTFSFLGFGGIDFVGLGFGSNLVYTDPFVERRAMSYQEGERFSTSTSTLARVSIDDLPDAIADSLLSQSPFPFDSIGVGISNEREDVIDAWGTVMIPGGSFDVIREKRVAMSNTVIEVKLPFIGWSDISGLIGFGGGDTTITYQYISNDAKEPIATVTMSNDESEVESVEFKDMGVITVGTHFVEEQAFEFTVSPNPSNGPVMVEISDLPIGDYQLVVYDLNGKILKNESFQSDNQFNYQFDNFTSGTYFFTLKNAKGQQIATEKLMINK